MDKGNAIDQLSSAHAQSCRLLTAMARTIIISTVKSLAKEAPSHRFLNSRVREQCEVSLIGFRTKKYNNNKIKTEGVNNCWCSCQNRTDLGKCTHQCDETQENDSTRTLSTEIVFFGCKTIYRQEDRCLSEVR